MRIRHCVIAVLLIIASSSCSNPRHVSVLHVNSIRGQIWPSENAGALTGGFSLLSTALKEARAAAPGTPSYTVAVFNAIHGTPEAHFTDGRSIVDLMNQTGFDALVVGPREFYFGLPALERLAKVALFPFLAANLVQDDGTPLGFVKPFYFDPKTRVGLIGLTPRQVLSQNLEQNVRGLKVLDEVEATRSALAELKKLGARTIGLFAGGVVWGGAPDSEDSAIAERLLDLTGIDQYWFGSPSPDREDGLEIVERPNGPRVVMTQSGARFTNGRIIALTTFAPSPEGMTFKAIHVDNASYEPDASLADTLYSIESAISETMNAPVAVSGGDFSLEFESECSMGDLVVDLFRDFVKTDVFLLNTGKIRSAFKSGPINRKAVYDTLPFGGNIVTARMTGSELIRVLNRSCTYVGNPQAGRGFLQVSGMSFSWDPSRPEMDKVLPESVRVGGKTLNPESTYLVGTEAYIFGGGDGYIDFREMGIKQDSIVELSILNLLEAALRDLGSVIPGEGGRIITAGG